MKKFLLLMVTFLASISSFAQGEGELVSNDITIVKDFQYRMYIKSYSDAAIKETNAGKKLTVKFSSDNETIVKPMGNFFKGVKAGTCNVTMKVFTVWPGTQDTPDPENMVMEKSFKVTVSEEDNIKVPTFELSWGLSREKAIENQKTWNHPCITDKYYEHFPNVVENNPDLVPQMEVFYNDNFESPITISQFNTKDNQLIATTLLFAAWERVNSSDSYMFNFLKNKGFKFSGMEGMYWNMTYDNEGIMTHASWEMVVIDNVWFASLMMHFDDGKGDDPMAGIENVETEFPEFDVHTTGTTIKINAANYVGSKVALYDLSGKCLSTSTVSMAGNEFNVPAHGMYIVKIDGFKSVRVVL